MKVPAFQRLAWILVLGLAVLTPGCASFNRDWAKAADQPPTSLHEGRWEGRWISDVNGHHGKLRCLLRRESDTVYQARFRAWFFGLFHAHYDVTFTGSERDGAWRFQGDKELSQFAGGVFHYEGSITATNFHSTYRSQKDHGTLELRRPD